MHEPLPAELLPAELLPAEPSPSEPSSSSRARPARWSVCAKQIAGGHYMSDGDMLATIHCFGRVRDGWPGIAHRDSSMRA